MKLEVGMYVRTKKRTLQCPQIARIRNISKDTGYKNQYYIELDKNLIPSYEYHIYKEDILKASHNIIDLIEVGDVITFKEDEDVYRVLQIPNKEWGFKNFYLVKNYDGETEDIFVEYDVMKKDINSIVTKEQFESMSYKVGE